MHINHTVSVVIRTCRLQNLFLLYQAIHSIISNDYRPIQIIIVVQTENSLLIDQISHLIKSLHENDIAFTLIVNHTEQDQRAKNLNLGIEVANGKYLCFLDDDDIFYENHISKLVETLEQNANFSWTYSDVLVTISERSKDNNIVQISSSTPYKKDKFNLDDFYANNFIPLHSYLLNKEKIDPSLLLFDEFLNVTEDYAFLLKISTIYEPLYCPEITCEYRMWNDSSNTNYYINIVTGKSDSSYKQKLRVWSEAAVKIEMLKLELNPNYKPATLVSSETRQKFMLRYPYLYRFKYRFPYLWDFLVKLFTKLQILK
jgi:glycosyltransferase involved in cell wall biosynthesis